MGREFYICRKIGGALVLIRMRQVCKHADKVGMSLNTCKTINAKTQSERVAEGDAILASIFMTEAVAA